MKKYLENIKFTVLENGYTNIGDYGRVISLKQIIDEHYDTAYDIKNKFDCPAAFRHDLGFHESVENKDNILKHFNGTACIDLDSPKDETKNKIWSNEYTANLWKNLDTILCENELYVMSELSFSGKGIHIMFNSLKCEWTEEMYYEFIAYCCNVVTDALIRLGFDENEIIGFDNKVPVTGKIIDGSAFDIVRKYFYHYTRVVFVNKRFDPNVCWTYTNKYKAINGSMNYKINRVDDEDIITNDKYTIKTIKTRDHIDSSCIDFTDEHVNRLKLCATILRIFINNNDGTNNSEVRKSALDYIIYVATELWKNKVDAQRFKYDIDDITKKTLSTLRGNFYINNDVLNMLKKNFGFDFDDPNVFHLNENEYLYDILDRIPFETGFNLLISGTGTGKTECWKKLTEWDPLKNERNKVVVCEPYVSIIESKYDNTAHRAHGSVIIDKEFKADLTVTNYNKIIKLDVEDAEKIDYLVIDESHLMFAEPYRWDVSNKFIRKLKEISSVTKIIFQTATPAFEQALFGFDDKHIFTIKKNIKMPVTVEYKNSYGNRKYLLWNAYKLANHYLDNNICDRVFIYNGDGGFRDNYTLPESKYKTGIYHKKNTDKECIDYIDAYHKMGDYKILITSCWFGVGHDLKDTDRCCVIICGNIPIHEEIQCVGRFRNAESIKCVIVTNEYNRHDNIYKSGLELEQIRGRLSDNNNYNSYIVGSTNIHVLDTDDVWYAWYLYKYGCMFNNIYRKIEAYDKLGWTVFTPMFNIDKDLCDKMMNCECKLKQTFGIKYELDIDKLDIMNIVGRKDEYKKNHKEHKKGDLKYTNYGCIKTNSDGNVDIYKVYNIGKKFDKSKADELDIKKELMKDYVLKRLYKNQFMDSDWQYINDECPEIDDWAKTAFGMHKYNEEMFNYYYVNHIHRLVDNDWYKRILRYINTVNKENYDIIEWLIVKFMIENDEADCSWEELIDDFVPIGFDILSLYCIFCLYGNNENKRIKAKHFDGMINLFRMTHDIAHDEYAKKYLYDNVGIVENNNFIDYVMSNGTIEFISNDNIIRSHSYSLGQVKNMYMEFMNSCKLNWNKSNYTLSSFKTIIDKHIKCENYINGVSKGKQIIITDKLPERTRIKYNLNLGDKFETQKELANKINKSVQTITQWRNKGWI